MPKKRKNRNRKKKNKNNKPRKSTDETVPTEDTEETNNSNQSEETNEDDENNENEQNEENEENNEVTNEETTTEENVEQTNNTNEETNEENEQPEEPEEPKEETTEEPTEETVQETTDTTNDDTTEEPIQGTTTEEVVVEIPEQTRDDDLKTEETSELIVPEQTSTTTTTTTTHKTYTPWNELQKNTRATNVPEDYKALKIYIVMINIKGAKDLIKADFMGKSDPFAILNVNDQKYITKIIKQNLNPIWNEHTTFSFTEPLNQPMKIELFDYDKGEIGKHDPLGNCTFNCMDLFKEQSPGFDGSLSLKDVKSGSIQLSMRGRIIQPYSLESRVDSLTEITNHQQKDIDNQLKIRTKCVVSNNKLKQDNLESDNKLSNLKTITENLKINKNKTEEKLEDYRREEEVTKSEIKLFGDKINKLENDTIPEINENIMNTKQLYNESKEKNKDKRSERANIKDDLLDLNRKCEDIDRDINTLKNGGKLSGYVVEPRKSPSSKSKTNEDDMRQPLLSN